MSVAHAFPHELLRTVEYSLIDSLGASKAVAVRLQEEAAVRTIAIVPDMVPTLQRFTVEVQESDITLSRGAALARGWRPIYQLVELERELRHWSHCDP